MPKHASDKGALDNKATIWKITIGAAVALAIAIPLSAVATGTLANAQTVARNADDAITEQVMDTVSAKSDTAEHEQQKAWARQNIEQIALIQEAADAEAARIAEEEAARIAEEEAAAAAATEYNYNYSYNSGSDYSDYNSGGGWKYTEYYPSENTGAFAYAPDLDITLGDDGTYRDQDGYVVVASSSLGKFEEVDTPYGTGKVYDTGCAGGIVDIYREG